MDTCKNCCFQLTTCRDVAAAAVVVVVAADGGILVNIYLKFILIRKLSEMVSIRNSSMFRKVRVGKSQFYFIFCRKNLRLASATRQLALN